MAETDLPSSQPIALDYSLTDKKLYILYKFSGYISVWDNQSQSLSILQFSGISDGRDIEVDAVNRRIYVLSNTGLFIIDMDNGTVLLNDAPMQGNSMGIDPANRFLFSASEGGSQIFKYSVASDLVSLLQTKNSAGSNARRIAINTAKGYVVLPCGGGNGAGYTVFAFDESNLNNVMGEFNIGTYPAYASFTTDGETLLGTCGDPYDTYIYVIDADSYVQQKKIFFPNADDYSRLCASASNTKIVAFSYDSYYDEEYVLYIFDL
jgi:DNA-binding beta-propeller fold protein YncE